ncbi:PQQ-binding-like beta-propeller repeat protein [Candidatus Latescibacterota bacterium]
MEYVFEIRSSRSKNKSFLNKRFCRKSLYSGLLIGLITFLFYTDVPAQDRGEWPAYHGFDRTNKSAETGLLKQWPANGPELLFEIEGLGEGYSTVSIARGLIFTAGRLNNETYVFVFDMNGKPVWKKPNGQAWDTTMSWARTYTGARSTPTYDDGVLYHLGETGRLTAFDHKTGDEIWMVNLLERFNATIPEYGYSESVFIEGDRLYCNPAGKSGFMVCLNKKDGSLIWANREIPGVAGYSSAIAADYGGFHQIINMSSNCAYGVDSKTGKLLWSIPVENKNSLNCTDAIYHDGYVFISAGYGYGCTLIKLNAAGGSITPQTFWQSELMDNHHGGIILHEGYLYGAGHEARGWFCLDFMTGKEAWKDRGKGSITYADGMIYMLEENGDIRLVKANPGKCEVAGSFEVPDGGKGMHWAHPVVCGGRLYVRHTDKVFVYGIK